MRLARDGGEHDQVAGPDQLLRLVMHGDPAAGAGLLQVATETGRAAGGQVVHAVSSNDQPVPARNVWMYRAISPVPKNPARTGRSRALAERAGRGGGQRGRPGRADDRAFQAGERVAGVVVVEDQHGRGARQAGRHVLREAGDPLHPVHPEQAWMSRSPAGSRADPGQGVRRTASRQTSSARWVLPSSASCTAPQTCSAVREPLWRMAVASAPSPSVMSRRRFSISPSV